MNDVFKVTTFPLHGPLLLSYPSFLLLYSNLFLRFTVLMYRVDTVELEI